MWDVLKIKILLSNYGLLNIDKGQGRSYNCIIIENTKAYEQKIRDNLIKGPQIDPVSDSLFMVEDMKQKLTSIQKTYLGPACKIPVKMICECKKLAPRYIIFL